MQKLQGFLLYLSTRPLLHLPRGKQNVFQNGLVGKELIALEDHADFLVHPGDGGAVPEDRLSVQENFAGLDRFQAVQAAQQRAFAAAGGANDDHHLALVNVQIKILKNRVLAEGFFQMPHAQKYIFHGYDHLFSKHPASRLMGQQIRKYSKNTTPKTPKAALGETRRLASMIC